MKEKKVSGSAVNSSKNKNMEEEKGLDTKFSLTFLINELKTLLKSDKWSKEKWKPLVVESLSTSQENSLFPWPNVCLTFVYFLMLVTFVCLEFDPWLLGQAILIILLLLLNLLVNIYNLYLTNLEMHRRVQDIVTRLETHLSNGISWSQENYPHLHTPLSASVVLQWTIRDGHKINLPWALLVKNDLIYLKPGQVAPGKCHSADNPKIVVNKGEVLHLLPDHHPKGNASPIPEFKDPVEAQLFILEETPYLSVVQKALQRHKLDRPTSRLTKYQHLFFVQLCSQLLAPAALILTLICNIVRFYQEPSNIWDLKLLILNPISSALPMVSLSFPVYWIVANYVALAKVMNDYLSFRHVHVTDDPFDDTPGHQQPNLILEKAKKASDPLSLTTSFVSALLGHGQYLSRTENLIHSLGSITALCCTDKKGILSWPNTSAEKIFILKTEEEEKEEKIVPEILTITHDHRNPFKVDFDDPSWRQYFNSLKPLGLGILLNTCNLSTEEKYTNFFNYLICESIRLENTTRTEENHGGIELLPIVTRGCLCELAKKIGFEPETVGHNYHFTNQLQTFRHIWGSGDTTSKFIRNLHLAHLKFPFPHMVSVTMREKASTVASNHLISQGKTIIFAILLKLNFFTIFSHYLPG